MNKNNVGRPKSENRARDYVIRKKHLNLSSIAREMGINRSSMTKFQKGQHDFSKEHQEQLEQILQRYGFRIKKPVQKKNSKRTKRN